MNLKSSKEIQALRTLYLIEARKANISLYESLNQRKQRYYDCLENRALLRYPDEKHELSKFYWNSPQWYFGELSVFLDKMEKLNSQKFDSKVDNIIKHMAKKNFLPSYTINLMGFGHDSLPVLFITDGINSVEARPILAGGFIQTLHIRFIIT